MKRWLILVLAALTLLIAACGTTENTATEPVKEEKAYVYPGEERQMAYKNPAYEDAAFAEGAPYAPKLIDETERETFSYTGTVHWVECHNNRVFTVLSLPEAYDGTQKYPLVLMLHGFNSTLDEWTYYVKGLNDAGYACLLFDFRGGHSGDQSRSDGKLSQMSFDTKLADIRAVMAYAETLEMVDSDNFLLAGHSQGGMMALITMCDAELKNRFNGVLLLAPYTDAKIVERYAAPEDVPDSASLLVCTVGKDYLYGAWKYEHILWDALPSYDRPVLLLTGSADEIVKVDSVRRVADTIGDNAIFTVVDGGYHDFQPELMKDVNETVTSFFALLEK